MEPPYDCQSCGACCVDYFGTPGYIQLAEGEPGRMRRLGLPVVEWCGQTLLGTGPHDGPGGDTGAAAFGGAVGRACAGSLHPERPGACREFEVGRGGCRFARQEAGLPD